MACIDGRVPLGLYVILNILHGPPIINFDPELHQCVVLTSTVTKPAGSLIEHESMNVFRLPSPDSAFLLSIFLIPLA